MPKILKDMLKIFILFVKTSQWELFYILAMTWSAFCIQLFFFFFLCYEQPNFLKVNKSIISTLQKKTKNKKKKRRRKIQTTKERERERMWLKSSKIRLEDNCLIGEKKLDNIFFLERKQSFHWYNKKSLMLNLQE